MQEEGEHFRRFRETHLQRGYQVEQMCRMVTDAGMQVVAIKDADTGEDVNEYSERVYVVAREQGKEV